MTAIDLNTPERGNLIKQMHLFVTPKPLARPRIKSMGGTSQTYTPMENQAEMMSNMCYYKPLYLRIPVIIDQYFVFPQFRNDPFPTSNKFGDVDNLAKAVNDNLVRTEIISDDRLVVGGEQFKMFGAEPMCVILIWEACVPA